MHTRQWCIARAIEQLECAREYCRWAQYHCINGNEWQEKANAGYMRTYLRAAGLFLNDAIEGDRDGRENR